MLKQALLAIVTTATLVAAESKTTEIKDAVVTEVKVDSTTPVATEKSTEAALVAAESKTTEIKDSVVTEVKVDATTPATTEKSTDGNATVADEQSTDNANSEKKPKNSNKSSAEEKKNK
jgi:hypothetical protein